MAVRKQLIKDDPCFDWEYVTGSDTDAVHSQITHNGLPSMVIDFTGAYCNNYGRNPCAIDDGIHDFGYVISSGHRRCGL